MKILVMSDSHKNMQSMRRAIGLEQPDEIIHLGDHLADARQLEREYPSIPMLMVAGNCDWFGESPPVLTPTRGGVKLFLTHGHQHHVKMSLTRLEYAAMEAEAGVALFGHTHMQHLDRVNGMWVMNPGTIGRGDYGLLTIENGQAECCLKKLPQEESK